MHSFPWSRLPYDIVPLILVHLDDASQCAFAATSRLNHTIVHGEAALAVRQKALREAAFDKHGDALLSALREHRAALRTQRNSFMLPANAPRGLVLAVASLVSGSLQRPTARYTPEQLADIGELPPQINVLLDCAWRFSDTRIGAFVCPPGVQGLDLQGNGIAWWAGDLALPEGVTHVNLARNAIGDSSKHLRFPASMRRVVLSDNWINNQDREALTARYPRIHFEF